MTLPRVDLVVIGLGYAGLPLVREAVRVGLSVAGYDVDERRVAALRQGRSYMEDVTDADAATLLREGFQASTDPACLAHGDAIIVCVPTPLDQHGTPDLSAIEQAGRAIALHLRSGTLVVLESTTYPGTTEELFQPLLESSGLAAGTDFALAYSPERIDPGNRRYGLRNTPKVVGGLTPACAERAAAFYGKFVDSVVLTSGTREAELAKLLENTYRHVNIALVNEMAVFCDELGVDFWDAIAAASTKPFGFQAFHPGPGVGGHCIPIDPNYLSYKARSVGYPFRFAALAQEINARMPAYVCARAQRLLNDHAKPVKGSVVLLLGVTYKPDIADQRATPAIPLARHLRGLGADVRFHDPHVERWEVDGAALGRVPHLEAALAEADLVILLQRHRAYDLAAIAEQAPLVLDTRGQMAGPRVERL
ncbi:MAG: nucleotide sugar dehydrogenase [Nitriliruptorales bacterium]|nr:nucleotide sugar dehydrogenase [Nitriliruptorales bacterium]